MDNLATLWDFNKRILVRNLDTHVLSKMILDREIMPNYLSAWAKQEYAPNCLKKHHRSFYLYFSTRFYFFDLFLLIHMNVYDFNVLGVGWAWHKCECNLIINHANSE